MNSLISRLTYPNGHYAYLTFYADDPKDMVFSKGSESEFTMQGVNYAFEGDTRAEANYPVSILLMDDNLPEKDYHFKIAADDRMIAMEVKTDNCNEAVTSNELQGDIVACGVNLNFTKSSGITESRKTIFDFN